MKPLLYTALFVGLSFATEASAGTFTKKFSRSHVSGQGTVKCQVSQLVETERPMGPPQVEAVPVGQPGVATYEATLQQWEFELTMWDGQGDNPGDYPYANPDNDFHGAFYRE